MMMVVLRLALTALFAYNLTHTIAEERSILRKDFYQSFAIVRYMYLVTVAVPGKNQTLFHCVF